MNGDDARLAELAVANDQYPLVEIDITSIKPQGLANPHAGHGEEADDAIIGPSTQVACGWKGQHRSKKLLNFSLGIEVGCGPPLLRKHARRRDLCPRVGNRHVPGEPANCGQAPGPGRWTSIFAHPFDGELAGYDRVVMLIHVRDEAA